MAQKKKEKEKKDGNKGNGTVTFLLILIVLMLSIPFLLSCSLCCGFSSIWCGVAGVCTSGLQFCEDFWTASSETSGIECGELYSDIANFFNDIDENIETWETLIDKSFTDWGKSVDKWGGKIGDWIDTVKKWEKKVKKIL